MKKKNNDSSIIKEDESRKSINSKEFIMNNGTRKVVITNFPISPNCSDRNAERFGKVLHCRFSYFAKIF